MSNPPREDNDFTFKTATERRIGELEARMASFITTAAVNQVPVDKLPLEPSEGQVAIFQNTQMAADGIAWTLINRSEGTASPYKWSVVGGKPLYSEVVISQSKTTSPSTYGDLASTGPLIELPLPGDYYVTIGFTGDEVVDGRIISMSYAIGATAATDTDSVSHAQVGDPPRPQTSTRTRLKTFDTAVQLTAKYRSNSPTGTPRFERRWMMVDPIRLG